MIKILKILIFTYVILFVFLFAAQKETVRYYNFEEHTDIVIDNTEREKEDIQIPETLNQIVENDLSYGLNNDTNAKKNELSSVQFTTQAPFGDWKDSRQQNGCEEATSIMAVYWALEKNLTPEIAEQEIKDIADFELEKYGNYIDTSSEDTVKRIFNDYFNFFDVQVKYNINIDDIIVELNKGNLVLVPTNGQKLRNPYYTQPGATHHELVIKGYSKDTNEFITNDPGTKRGESYRYKTNILFDAIYDYKTGDNEIVDEIIKAMIIVECK